jgi:hypothetical protein
VSAAPRDDGALWVPAVVPEMPDVRDATPGGVPIAYLGHARVRVRIPQLAAEDDGSYQVRVLKQLDAGTRVCANRVGAGPAGGVSGGELAVVRPGGRHDSRLVTALAADVPPCAVAVLRDALRDSIGSYVTDTTFPLARAGEEWVVPCRVLFAGFLSDGSRSSTTSRRASTRSRLDSSSARRA